MLLECFNLLSICVSDLGGDARRRAALMLVWERDLESSGHSISAHQKRCWGRHLALSLLFFSGASFLQDVRIESLSLLVTTYIDCQRSALPHTSLLL